MPRRRRLETINEYHLDRIQRQIGLLRSMLEDADRRLAPFRPHSDAIAGLRRDLVTALNLLNDRPADYEEPHAAPFSRG
jgi:hypothetical protein